MLRPQKAKGTVIVCVWLNSGDLHHARGARQTLGGGPAVRAGQVEGVREEGWGQLGGL